MLPDHLIKFHPSPPFIVRSSYPLTTFPFPIFMDLLLLPLSLSFHTRERALREIQTCLMQEASSELLLWVRFVQQCSGSQKEGSSNEFSSLIHDTEKGYLQ